MRATKPIDTEQTDEVVQASKGRQVIDKRNEGQNEMISCEDCAPAGLAAGTAARRRSRSPIERCDCMARSRIKKGFIQVPCIVDVRSNQTVAGLMVWWNGTDS
jgi:hypothetical protein